MTLPALIFFEKHGPYNEYYDQHQLAIKNRYLLPDTRTF